MKFEIPSLYLTWYTILSLLVWYVCGQHEPCRMYGLDTSCRYRIDGISLSAIRVVINQCTHPVQVTFSITNVLPPVDFEHIFNSADTLVSVPGFTIETKLQVKLTELDDDVINVEADFHVYNKPKTDFVNDDIKLWGANELCPGLNTSAKISVGVMGTLAVIAGILVVILIFIKYQRTHKDNNTGSQLTVNSGVSGSPLRSENVHQRTESHGFGERRSERYNQARQHLPGNHVTLNTMSGSPPRSENYHQRTESHGFNERRPERNNRTRQHLSGNQLNVNTGVSCSPNRNENSNQRTERHGFDERRTEQNNRARQHSSGNQLNVNTGVSGSPNRNENSNQRTERHGFDERRTERNNRARLHSSGNQSNVNTGVSGSPLRTLHVSDDIDQSTGSH